MSDEACGLWVDVWMSILVEELPRLGRAIASIGATEAGLSDRRRTPAREGRKRKRDATEPGPVGDRAIRSRD